MALKSMTLKKVFSHLFSKPKRKWRDLLCWTILSTFTVMCGCGYMLKRKLTTPAQFQSLDNSSPFLKAHMHNGRVYILSSWKVDSEKQTVTGQGKILNANREVLETGEFTIPIDSVAIFETNTQHMPRAVQVKLIVLSTTILTMGLGVVAMLLSPPPSYGSCPTFYVSDGNSPLLQAEGFSASVAPVLEASDVDALYHAQPADSRFEVQMKNEMLETHVVRHVDLLAAKRQSGGRVFLTDDGTFWETDTIVEPNVAAAPEGDCLKLLQHIDGQERFSEADSEYLATRETLDLEFDNVEGSTGLVIAARQSLMSTFLFYQGLSYMGRSAGQWIAVLERGDPAIKKAVTGIGQILGGIEVLLQDDAGNWISIGEVNETGPLATDVHLVKLPPIKRERVNIRLRLTKGHWRLDAVKLVKLGEELDPVRLSPVAVNQNGVSADEAYQLLTDREAALTTLPGDVYTLVYQLPKDFESYELFLESRGYYLEWIREEWLADENPALAAMMLFNPERALRILAPEFKKIEVDMEKKFWRSRYERPQ